MHPTLVIGVDPGLVHTGVVQMLFLPELRRLKVSTEAIVGPNANATRDWLTQHKLGPQTSHVFIEGYRPRSNLNSDARMVAAVNEIRTATRGTVLLNTGVKKVVRRPLMELLGVWKFGTVTHHQDLRSAARIALLGMLKDDDMNRLVTTVVKDHLAGVTWDVEHH